jgi:hypothetical protein
MPVANTSLGRQVDTSNETNNVNTNNTLKQATRKRVNADEFDVETEMALRLQAIDRRKMSLEAERQK